MAQQTDAAGPALDYLLQLTDEQFELAWIGLTQQGRESLGERGRARAQSITDKLQAEIQEIKRGKPKGNNGHDLESAAESPRPLDWGALEGREPPQRRWATDTWFGFGHVTLMVGAGGIGKTLIAQQWASALSLGTPFIDATPQPLRVLMWACEDDHDELWRRQLAIAQWLKQPLGEFAKRGLVLIPRHGSENTILTTEFGRPLFTSVLAELREQAMDYEADAVILDNAAQVYGCNENDRGTVTRFLNRLSGAMPGKAIMLLAHPSRAPGSEFSGSGAWEAVARTRLYLGRNLPDQKEPEDDTETVRYLARRKANYSARDYRKFDYQNGVLKQDAEEGATGMLGHLKDKRAERVVSDGLLRIAEMSVRATDGKTSPSYLPRLITEYKLHEGLTMRDLGDAMRTLMLRGIIVRGVIGKYENRTPMYGLKVTGQAGGLNDSRGADYVAQT